MCILFSVQPLPPQSNTVMPTFPISPPLMVNSPEKKFPDFHSVSPPKPQTADQLLDFYLGADDDNSNSGSKSSPPKTAPPAPPGATICKILCL